MGFLDSKLIEKESKMVDPQTMIHNYCPTCGRELKKKHENCYVCVVHGEWSFWETNN